MRSHPEVGFIHHRHGTGALRAVAPLLVLLAASCRTPEMTVNQSHPETGSNGEAEHSRNNSDGGPVDAAAGLVDAQATTFTKPEHPSLDGGKPGEAGAASARDASHGEKAAPDAHVTSGADAGTVAVAGDAATCEVDACNYAGTCIRRDWWTECSCAPSALSHCDFPRFRSIGPSRTDRERTLYLISGDGRVVAGTHAFDAVAPTSLGVTWTLEKGLQPLAQDPAGPTVPTSINVDGSIIAGVVERDRGETLDVVWRDGVLERVSPDSGVLPVDSHATRIPPDGTAATRYFDVFDAADDGRMVVGRTRRSNDNSRTEAAFWTPDDGVRFLSEYLTAQGMNMSGWELWHISAVSDDGNTMIGLGIGPDVGYRWYLQLAAPAR
jgi:hypothetical protein